MHCLTKQENKISIETGLSISQLLPTEARNSETVSISRIKPDKSRKRKGTPGKTSGKSKLLPYHHSNEVYLRLPSVVSSDEDPQVYKRGVISGTKIVFLKLTEMKPVTSVSYTHLRAHETSLHLVCRLLLEKSI